MSLARNYMSKDKDVRKKQGFVGLIKPSNSQDSIMAKHKNISISAKQASGLFVTLE